MRALLLYGVYLKVKPECSSRQGSDTATEGDKREADIQRMMRVLQMRWCQQSHMFMV